MPSMPSRTASLRSSLMLSSVKPGSVLPSYSFIFCTRVSWFFLGSSSRVSTAHMAAISSVCGAMCFPRILAAL